MDFGEYQADAVKHDGRQVLVIFSGVPGTGKSSLADGLALRLGIPVFAIDWLLGALTPFGGRAFDHLMDIGVEQLTTLALRQLMLGQSAIIDTPTEDPASRARWRSLAARFDADFRVVVCSCPDRAEHRSRLEGRRRGIPGWHEAGNWANVEAGSTRFPSGTATF